MRSCCFCLFSLFIVTIFVGTSLSLSIPTDIDLTNLKEGTVTKPDGSKVTTQIKKESDKKTVITITETSADGGSEIVRTITRTVGSASSLDHPKGALMDPLRRIKITSDHNPTQEEFDELNADHKPGTTTKPDGTKVTTTIDKKADGSSVTTITEMMRDGTEKTKIIMSKSDGSRHMETTIKGAKVKEDPEKMKFAVTPQMASQMADAAKPGFITQPDGTKVKTTVTTEMDGTVVTKIETTKPDGTVHTKIIKKLCDETNH
ncbi:hypothetical protein L596_030539 [Steinernema carpocapsae]|uniref:Uncharacterized protein n=1 Tax=Steinernema carpocapsae TaxID=34508 RepID=A0A4U5LPP3_STECR|nr:hypothetical protein L596_030539 [Steinernema carpocapsae]